MCLCWSKSSLEASRQAYKNARDIQAAQAAAARNYLAQQNGTHDGSATNTPYKNNASMSYMGVRSKEGDDGTLGGDTGGFATSNAGEFRMSGTGGFGGGLSLGGGDSGMSSGGGGMSSGGGGMSSGGGGMSSSGGGGMSSGGD